MSDSLSSVWGHLVHFAKFPNAYCSHRFHPISTNFTEGMVIRVEYRILLFWRSAKKITKLWHIEIFVNTGPY